MRVIAALVCVFGMTGAAYATEIGVATFNTESDTDTRPEKVSETIRGVNGVDIWALQEVESDQALRTYRAAARSASGGNWRYIISEAGSYSDPDRKADFLGILYRTDLFRQIETVEFHAIRSSHDGSKYGKANWGLRSALFLRLLHYDSGEEFYVGVVHLKCCGDGVNTREHQAGLIAEWLRRANVPVILVGDTNIPIKPQESAGDVSSRAFRKLTGEGGLIWIEPSNPYKTQCNPRFNSMLDQIYHTGNLPVSAAVAEIRFATADYCDGDALGYSDHRPVVGQFTF